MAVMARFIKQGQFDQRVRALTERVVEGIFPHDYLSEYVAVLNYVRRHVRYVRDPRTIEQVKTPVVVLETRNGDCDDMAVAIGTMVGQIGAKVRLVAAGFRGAPQHKDGRPVLGHIWVEAFDPASRSWIVLDPVPGRKVHQMLGRVARTLTLEVL